jgi:hypothetical protein
MPAGARGTLNVLPRGTCEPVMIAPCLLLHTVSVQSNGIYEYNYGPWCASCGRHRVPTALRCSPVDQPPLAKSGSVGGIGGERLPSDATYNLVEHESLFHHDTKALVQEHCMHASHEGCESDTASTCVQKKTA